MTGDIDIRLLAETDVDGAVALSSVNGWNQRAAEWHIMLQIAPSGSFAAVSGDRIVGTAIGIDYGSYGWIAMMLVDPKCRRQGIGARLLEAAIGAVPPELPVRLDATPLGRPLYERYGFELETPLTRHVRPAGPAAPAGSLDHVRPLVEADLPRVMQMDDRISGGHRHGPIRWLFADGPRYGWIGSTRSESLSYCLGRGGRLFDHIGPIVADTTAAAIELATAAAAASAGRSLVIDAYDGQRDFSSWLRSAAFEPQRPLYRMRRQGAGAAPSARRPASPIEFAIMGPEFS